MYQPPLAHYTYTGADVDAVEREAFLAALASPSPPAQLRRANTIEISPQSSLAQNPWPIGVPYYATRTLSTNGSVPFVTNDGQIPTLPTMPIVVAAPAVGMGIPAPTSLQTPSQPMILQSPMLSNTTSMVPAGTAQLVPLAFEVDLGRSPSSSSGPSSSRPTVPSNLARRLSRHHSVSTTVSSNDATTHQVRGSVQPTPQQIVAAAAEITAAATAATARTHAQAWAERRAALAKRVEARMKSRKERIERNRELREQQRKQLEKELARQEALLPKHELYVPRDVSSARHDVQRHHTDANVSYIDSEDPITSGHESANPSRDLADSLSPSGATSRQHALNQNLLYKSDDKLVMGSDSNQSSDRTLASEALTRLEQIQQQIRQYQQQQQQLIRQQKEYEEELQRLKREKLQQNADSPRRSRRASARSTEAVSQHEDTAESATSDAVQEQENVGNKTETDGSEVYGGALPFYRAPSQVGKTSDKEHVRSKWNQPEEPLVLRGPQARTRSFVARRRAQLREAAAEASETDDEVVQIYAKPRHDPPSRDRRESIVNCVDVISPRKPRIELSKQQSPSTKRDFAQRTPLRSRLNAPSLAQWKENYQNRRRTAMGSEVSEGSASSPDKTAQASSASGSATPLRNMGDQDLLRSLAALLHASSPSRTQKTDDESTSQLNPKSQQSEVQMVNEEHVSQPVGPSHNDGRNGKFDAPDQEHPGERMSTKRERLRGGWGEPTQLTTPWGKKQRALRKQAHLERRMSGVLSANLGSDDESESSGSGDESFEDHARAKGDESGASESDNDIQEPRPASPPIVRDQLLLETRSWLESLKQKTASSDALSSAEAQTPSSHAIYTGTDPELQAAAQLLAKLSSSKSQVSAEGLLPGSLEEEQDDPVPSTTVNTTWIEARYQALFLASKFTEVSRGQTEDNKTESSSDESTSSQSSDSESSRVVYADQTEPQQLIAIPQGRQQWGARQQWHKHTTQGSNIPVGWQASEASGGSVQQVDVVVANEDEEVEYDDGRYSSNDSASESGSAHLRESQTVADMQDPLHQVSWEIDGAGRLLACTTVETVDIQPITSDVVHVNEAADILNSLQLR